MPVYQSKERFCSVHTPLGEDVLLLSQMRGHEVLSRLFRFECDFLSEKSDIDFEKIIGQKATIELTLENGKKQNWNGHIARFSQGASQGKFTVYSAEIVPWFWLLTRTSDCKIFQELSVTEIIGKVFQDYGFSDFRLPATSYPKKDYCVQYRETDFNFVSRLMEEAGIGYFFEHSDKGHTLVCFDKPEDNPKCPGQNTANYARTSAGGTSVGDIESWDVEHELPSGSYTTTDYNMKNPGTDLEASSLSQIKVGGNTDFELFDYPGEYQTVDDGGVVARVRMQAEESASVEARASTNCAAFSPGYRFELRGHYRRDYNVAYLLREVTHHITQDVGGDEGQGSHYSNDILCLPHSIPFRPIQSTPKPLISGVQTALVVGPSGEEIHVDDHGRIKVQFHWDRLGKEDENSSCWIRVSQNWAGSNWGGVFNPRIGQEVIIDFLEGDPDRPICVGRVYNAAQTVPYTLPANKTQSGVKSRSTKDGSADNFNEIRMEDKKGEEELYIHAEKDRNEVVENDMNQEVGHDRMRKVVNDETVEIGNDRTVTVTKNHSENVGANETLVVAGERSREVTKREDVKLGDEQVVEIAKSQTVTIGKEMTLSVAKDRSETVGASYGLEVEKDIDVESGKAINIEAANEIVLKTGSAQIVMKSNGDIVIKGNKINVKGSGDVTIKGSQIKEN